MSILIRGMEMPKNCGACPLRLAWCRERIYMVTRPERCPLVPVPPHGRLIDADAAKAHFKDEGMRVSKLTVMAVLNNAQTIIEAEEG